MSEAMYEAARRTGNNPYILHDIEAYLAATELGVSTEQLAEMERGTLELASRLARAAQLHPNPALRGVKVEYTEQGQY